MAKKIFTTSKNPVLYEINTVAWLFELSKKLGRRVTLGNVPADEWERLSKIGIELVWLMGIWHRSHAGRNIALHDPGLRQVYSSALPGWTEEDVIGSSYSISAYEPDPSAGTWDDLDAVHSELHRHGIGLILDFIPNHTGIDFPWVTEHPDYYIQGSLEDYQKDKSAFLIKRYQGKRIYLAHGRDPYFPPWSDTVQLNYFNPALRREMVKEIERIAGHCDGFRCDMAVLVLNDVFNRTWGWAKHAVHLSNSTGEFWSQATGTAPGMIWIAEAYWDTERLFQGLGFDNVYDKKLYDLAKWSSPQDVRNYLKSDVTFQEKLLRFLENHDEERAVAAFGRKRLPAAAVLFATLPGMRLYHHGQFDAKRVRIPLQLRQAVEESPDTELRALYQRLLSITTQQVFHEGDWKFLDIRQAWDDSFNNLIAYMWRLGDKMKLVVVNPGQSWSQGRIPIQGGLLESRDYLLTDELNGKEYVRNGEEIAGTGLHVILDGYHAHIFDFT